MTLGGQFHRQKFKPPTILYIEEHLKQFFKFMETMSPEYITYVTSISGRGAVYFEQTTPLIMNREQTLTTVATDLDFIPAGGAATPVGFIDADFSNLKKAFLLMVGRAVNTFAGQNNLNCTVATDNQWQINIDAGAHSDLENVGYLAVGKADGQMLDTDWECMAQGVIHPFTFMFEITDFLTAIHDRIGLRLAHARSRQNNLIVTLDIYLKVVWKL